MRRRRSVFLDSLIALAISWGTAYYFRQEAKEVMFHVFTVLGLLCLIILIPFSLHNLPSGSPFKRGASFAVSLSPLFAVLTHPFFFLDPFSPLWLSLGLGTTYTWIAKGVISFLFFLLVGCIFSMIVPPENVTWKKALMTLLILILLYAGIFYAGTELFEFYPYL